MPAVRQLASPTSTYSIGVIAWSSDAKISGWSASNELSVLCCCSCPRPKKPLILARLCVPLIHLHLARQVNCVEPGAPFKASRASSSAWTFTPLLTLVVAISGSSRCNRARKPRIIHRCRAKGTRDRSTAPRQRDMMAPMSPSGANVGPGARGTVETEYLELHKPVELDCGCSLHPVRIAYETYGTLSPARDNVILVCHALSGDAHAAGFSKQPPVEST